VTPVSFRVLDPTKQDDFQEWVAVWSRTTHREVQAHPSYGLALTPTEDRFLGAIASRDAGSVILPFAVREIPISSTPRTWDAITPYGYGGAYLDGEFDADWFWTQWDRWAQEHGLVGITVRSHLFDDEVLPVTGPTVNPLANVVVDLKQSAEQLWEGYAGRVRTDIRRGRGLGVQVLVDEDCSELKAFYQIYLETMKSKGAADFYFFDLTRLERMVTALGSGVALFHAYVDGRLVATEMQLLGTKNAYYFLSGSTAEGRLARANPVMKHQVILWLKARGLRRYVLGGGMTRDDSLFRYKRAYSPQSVHEFMVAFHESRPGFARELVSTRKRADPDWHPVAGFIPAYRAPRGRAGLPS
jgi:hypothetical protein